MGTKTFATFLKNKDFKPKKDQFGPKLHFSPYNVFYFWFGALLDQKTMQAGCLGSFLICGYQNFAPSQIYKDIMSSIQKLLSFRYQKSQTKWPIELWVLEQEMESDEHHANMRGNL